MDELPQLFNVLKGDMSLVGPRPVNPEIYERHVKKGLSGKELVKAGIAGPFQSQKGNHTKTDVELDMEYAQFCKNNSGIRVVLYDIKILLKTFIVVLKAKGI